MIRERLKRLTDREREALRLVPSYGTFREIAVALGVSESAIRERLQNAAKKLGVRGRHAAARLLLAHEQGEPPRFFAGVPKQQVAEIAPKSAELSHQDEVLASTERDTATLYSPPPMPIRDRLVRILAGEGESNDLTIHQRLRRIAIWIVVGITLFCLLGAVLNELGQAGRLHRTSDRTTL